MEAILRSGLVFGKAALLGGLLAGCVETQEAQQATGQAASGTFTAGSPLGVMVEDQFSPMSENVKVYGGVVNAESCSYHEGGDLIVVVNRGVNQDQVPNDGFISLLNHDGSVHTANWIGTNREGLILNHPLGSDTWDGRLYVADRDGGTSDQDPSVSVIRWFDLETGAPMGEVPIDDSEGFNDLAIAEDGTIYATDTGASRLYEVSPDGSWRVLLDGAPLNLPNGVAMDNDGNIVIVNIGDAEVITLSPTGATLATEQAVQAGNDGLVILEDGTKYVSSVREGGVSRIRPGEPAELIASNIPSAASMCYDVGGNQLVIPLNPNNAVAIVPLD
ncbi:MAG: gluconolaconase [Gemmatimonas sp.]|nr:gluconolaconase [Gemmatimonas sp.]